MPDSSRPTPAQEAEVRRRLADARHEEPVPAEVADRLDRVLADLASEPGRTATVVRLSQRRRRAATLLVAAAAVVVAGVGLGQVISGLDGSAMNGMAGDGAVTSEEEAAGGASDEFGADAEGAPSTTSDALLGRVRPDRFADDVRRLRRVSPQALLDADRSAQETDGQGSFGRADCPPGAWGRGVYRAVRYGSNTGYVVFRRPQGDTQVADLFLCGAELATRSVTLPSP